MTFNPNDPKWTAYVAGELDAAERAVVEQELAESAEARALVADIERVIGSLVTQLKTEPVPAAAATKVALATPAGSSPTGRSIPWGWLTVGGVSACVVAGLMMPALNGAREASRKVAMVDEYDRDVESTEMAPTVSKQTSMTRPATEAAAPYERDARFRSKYVLEDSQFSDFDRTSGLPPASKDLYLEHPPSGGQGPAKVAKNLVGNRRDEGKRSEEYYKSPSPDNTKNAQPSIDGTVSKPQFETKTKDLAPQPTSPVPSLTTTPSSNRPGQPVSGSGLVRESGRLDKSVTDSPTSNPLATRPRGETENAELPALQPARPITSTNPVAQPADPAAPHPYNVAATAVPGPVVAPPLPPGEQTAGGKDGRFAFTVPPTDGEIAQPRPDVGGEAYEQVTDNAFMAARENPLSTFSIDVDTASYSNIRRFLTQNRMLPPPAAVRIEEMVNYFRYNYPQPDGETPFQANIEVASCPWNQEHRLVRVGIKGREIASNKRPPSNLVFLVDVSGSMSPANKLPLVKEGLKMLTRQLTENDRIAIVVYAGSSGLVLPSTTGDKQQTILDALDRLEAGGSTNGAQGIQLAYEIALQNFLKGCTNRVILATDGDFNVGITDRGQLTSLIEQQAKSGVFLTTLGFGMGNIKDATLEQLADKGNGAYAYVDDLREAKKVLVDEMSGTLVTIAKDVKIQIEFNPAEVGSYRLIGYENRILKHEDFNNDAKDAGEIGAGHTVTALYEVVPVGQMVLERPTVDPLKYQPKPATPKAEPVAGEQPGELLTLKLRYKQPDGDTSKLLEYPVKDSGQRWAQASGDFKFAASVALFGMILRNSPHKGTATLDAVAELANEGRGSDESGYRQEFISLVNTAKGLGK